MFPLFFLYLIPIVLLFFLCRPHSLKLVFFFSVLPANLELSYSTIFVLLNCGLGGSLGKALLNRTYPYTELKVRRSQKNLNSKP